MTATARNLDADSLAKELGLDRAGIERRRQLFGLGKGATFTLRLPLQGPTSASAAS